MQGLLSATDAIFTFVMKCAVPGKFIIRLGWRIYTPFHNFLARKYIDD
jgi:hypothetical protein